jgi:hypothetical protein
MLRHWCHILLHKKRHLIPHTDQTHDLGVWKIVDVVTVDCENVHADRHVAAFLCRGGRCVGNDVTHPCTVPFVI